MIKLTIKSPILVGTGKTHERNLGEWRKFKVWGGFIIHAVRSKPFFKCISVIWLMVVWFVTLPEYYKFFHIGAGLFGTQHSASQTSINFQIKSPRYWKRLYKALVMPINIKHTQQMIVILSFHAFLNYFLFCFVLSMRSNSQEDKHNNRDTYIFPCVRCLQCRRITNWTC